MTRILHIIGSPRGHESNSSTLATTYINARLEKEPYINIDTLNLWNENLPEFSGDQASAKMTFFGVGEMNDSLKTVWDEIVAIVDRFTSADEIVVSVPMWNGSIPYKLKHYIDIITQPGLLFGFDPEVGYSGLLENKKAVVFYTSGVFSPGANEKYGTDFHSTYLSWWFDLIGVNDVKAVRFQPSLLTGTPEEDLNHALVRASAV